MACKFDLPRRRAEKCLHRAFVADRLLERVARQGRIAAQPRELIGEPRQAIDRGADTVDSSIQSGRKQRAHQ
jgi:hypothetical protein